MSTSGIISDEVLAALVERMAGHRTPRAFDHLFQNDLLPLHYQALYYQASGGRLVAEYPHEPFHRRQRKRYRQARRQGWVTADIVGVTLRQHILVRHEAIEPVLGAPDVLLRLTSEDEQGSPTSCVVRIQNAQRNSRNHIVHVRFCAIDTPDEEVVHALPEIAGQAMACPDTSGLRSAFLSLLHQDKRFCRFGDAWFLASKCPPITEAQLATITGVLATYPTGIATTDLLLHCPEYAAGMPEDVRCFALNWRLLSEGALHCLSRIRAGKWMLREVFEADRSHFTPQKVRAPRGGDILPPDELKPVWIDDKQDRALETDAGSQAEPPQSAKSNRNRSSLTLTLSFGEWTQGALHLTDAEAAFFRLDSDEETHFEDATTARRFQVRFCGKRPDRHEDNLLYSCDLSEWIHGNCLIPAAYIDIYRTEDALRFSIGWRRVERSVEYRRREWNGTSVTAFTETFSAHCDFDPDYFIEQERLEDILVLQHEAETAGAYWQIMVGVLRRFDTDGRGLTPREILRYTDAVRPVSHRTVYPILSRYPCFERGDDGRYRLDETRVGRPRLRSGTGPTTDRDEQQGLGQSPEDPLSADDRVLAYVLGLVCANGRAEPARKCVTVDFRYGPYRDGLVRGDRLALCQDVVTPQGIADVVGSIQRRAGDALAVTSQQRSNRLYEVTLDFGTDLPLWDTVLSLLDGKASFREFAIPSGIVAHPDDEVRREFARGFFDSAGLVTSSCRAGPNGRHRVYIRAYRPNLHILEQLRSLLETLGVRVSEINHARPGEIREYQMRIFAEEALKIGFQIRWKQQLLEDMAKANEPRVAAAIRVRLTDEQKALLSKPVQGQGGYQSLLRRLQGSMVGDELALTLADAERLIRSSESYGSGGFQDRLRSILTAVKQEYSRHGVSCASTAS